MFEVKVEKDEQVENVRWLKASHNGVAWSLIEVRSNFEALQIIEALQQSMQPTPRGRGSSARSRVRKSKVALPAKSG